MSVPIHVLHVEDNREFASMTKTWLERKGEAISVERVPTPADGLDWLADSRPDCIVSDYQMPGMTGIEFLREVRKENPKLPFILFTSKEGETVAPDALDAGVTDYLQKNTGVTQYTLLANRIEHAVGKRRAETDYRELLETTPNAIAVHDADTAVVVDANERFCALVGREREDVLGHSLAELSAGNETTVNGGPADNGGTVANDDIHDRITGATHGEGDPFEWTVDGRDGDRRTVEVTLRTAEIGGVKRVLSFIHER